MTAIIFAFSVTTASAKIRVVRIAKQYGIAYVPLTIIEKRN